MLIGASLENLPQFMSHLREVQDLGGNCLRWTAGGPLGVPVSWEAEIISDIPRESICWRSIGDADVVRRGFGRFPTGGW